MPEIPSPELVAEAYFRSVLPDYGITTKLPKLTVLDNRGLPRDNWGGKTSWITIRPSGAAVVYAVPAFTEAITINVWTKPGKLAWGHASNLTRKLMEYARDWYSSVTVEMPYQGYYSAQISSIFRISGVREHDNDPQELAHLSFDSYIAYKVIN